MTDQPVHGHRPAPRRGATEPIDNPIGRYTCRCGQNCYNATELDAHIHYGNRATAVA